MKPQLLTNKLTDEQRFRLNSIYRMLVKGTTKEEISNQFGCSERQARDYISYIKKVKPVIAVSSSKGYKVARTIEDVELAKQTLNEIRSRKQDLIESEKPLIEFLQSAGVYEQQ